MLTSTHGGKPHTYLTLSEIKAVIDDPAQKSLCIEMKINGLSVKVMARTIKEIVRLKILLAVLENSPDLLPTSFKLTDLDT